MNAVGKIVVLAGGGALAYYAYRNRATLSQSLSPVVNLFNTTSISGQVCRNYNGDVIPCGSMVGVGVTAAPPLSMPDITTVPTQVPVITPTTPPTSFIGSGPRGIRNNNPGNIVYSPSNNWLGQTGSDGHFAMFSSMIFGLRALFSLLKTYVSRGWNTPGLIAQHWAPPSENNTSGYANTLAQVSGIGINTPISASFGDLSRIARGIIVAENGAAYAPFFDTGTLMLAWGTT